MSGKGSSSGWLTTKKRGRDDEAIKRDRKIALEQRKQHRKKKRNSNAIMKSNINVKTKTIVQTNKITSYTRRISIESIPSY